MQKKPEVGFESGDGSWLQARMTGPHGPHPDAQTHFNYVIDIMRVEQSQIVEHWGVADGLGALRQIEGVAPASDS